MPPAKSPYRLFIVSTSTNKTDPEARKQIRSHVMMGKNCKRSRHDKPETLEVIGSMAEAGDQSAFSKRFPIVIPQKVGSDLTFTTFPDTIDRQAAFEAVKCAVSMAKARYVLEPCLIFGPMGSVWSEQLSVNALFLQSVILMAQTYFDLMGGRNSNHPSQKHIKTLQLLREKLSFGDEKEQVADPTMFVVVNLAVQAHMSGEHRSARYHLEGVRKIVELRGGLNNIKQPKLSIELLRCDVGMSLHTGAKPLFFSDYNHVRLSLPYPHELIVKYEAGRVLDKLDNLDEGIAKAWQVMTRFCSLINLAAEAEGRIPWELLLNTMASIMYRLLYMSFEVSSINEAIRLGLLALSSHIFLQWKLMTVTYVHLSDSYRNCLERLRSRCCAPFGLSTWLLMIGAVSIFKPSDESWLRPLFQANIETSGIKSWREMRNVLESFLWIPLVHENSGREFFDSVVGSQ